ncbi:MAG: phosphopyruvate hydratase [Candidatus Staskawiczbacteria bacterium]|nr:phosphopyruvate hydratase [Candidatus Staskawiczbacteria bacterium]
MSKIKNIIAREIKDSRGKPTLEVEVETEKGVFVDSVPSGASTGTGEALELRDEDGKGVTKAILNVNEIIAPKLKGLDVLNQTEIDRTRIELDGTENKSKLGANAILGVSMAVCRAGAGAKKVPLYQHIAELGGHRKSYNIPLAMFNILNGGRHAKNGLDIQEFMIIPQKKTFMESLVSCNKIFNNLKENIEKSFGKEHLELGDEGGFAPPVKTAEQALFLLKSALEGETDVKFALDCASSEFYKDGKYILEGQEMHRNQLLDFYKNLVQEFPIISIEDPFSEEDWEGFKDITKEIGGKITIVGDDLTTTNIKAIKEAHNQQAINAVLIKLNQIGSVTETIEAINMTKSFGWKAIISHRSGETLDNFIADLAVGSGADFLKAGSPAKEERMVKYQRLLEIEQEISK